MGKENSKRALGKERERQAAHYLQTRGVRICTTNFAGRQGEIDIIGYHGDCLVFVEVKYRRDAKRGTPESAVTMQKQRRICRTADYYRYLHHYGDERPFRYDVVAISGESIRWYENAFEHVF